MVPCLWLREHGTQSTGYIQIDERSFFVFLPYIVVNVSIVVVNEGKHMKHVEFVSMPHCLGISRKVYQLNIGPFRRLWLFLILQLMPIIV